MNATVQAEIHLLETETERLGRIKGTFFSGVIRGDLESMIAYHAASDKQWSIQIELAELRREIQGRGDGSTG